MKWLPTFALLPLVALAPAAPAQNPATAPPAAPTATAPAAQEDQAAQIETLEVFLPVMVFDKDDKFVPGLTRNNFRIFENGKEQRIEQFEAPTQLPLNVGILIDTSSSVKRKLKFEQEAAIDFVLSILKGTTDRALFATFDSTVTLRQDFTNNTGDLAQAIQKIKAGGDTKLYDAVYRVCEEKMGLLPAGQRAVIVIVTDGEDTASDRTLEQAIEIAQRSNVTIFGISTRNYSDISAGLVRNSVDKNLQKLCEDTGGRTFLPYQRLELAKAFAGIANLLRNEYVLYYTPDNQLRDGKFRNIKVEVNGVDRKVQINAKRGYYAMPIADDQVPR